MHVTKVISLFFKRFLPSPFTIAVVLTLFTMAMVFFFTDNPSQSPYFFTILSYWEQGIWNTGLLVFAYQMMLILVLGHVLVLSRPMERLMVKVTRFASNTATAAVLVAVSTMLVSFCNWGLGLIFGALLARKIAEHAQRNQQPLNYPLIGACGYVGLMVWHGGISGSAPLKVAEAGHIKSLMSASAAQQFMVPDVLSTSETIFSPSNLVLFAMVLVTVGVMAFVLGKRTKPTKFTLAPYRFQPNTSVRPKGADRLNYSQGLSILFATIIFLAFAVQYLPAVQKFHITPNTLNLFMLGMAILLHGSFQSFLNAVEAAIGDVSGILIQFPLYFGIMGMMSSSGMIGQISDYFVSVSTPTTLPIFTFFSAGLVNIFVPSGGGQWAVQGPLVLQSAAALEVPYAKVVLALAYGDQITNMLQPFWALPLLGITKLKAQEILPYTLIFMVVGALIYLFGLLVL